MKIGQRLVVCVLVSLCVSGRSQQLAAKLSSGTEDFSHDEYNSGDKEMSWSVRNAGTSGRTSGTRPMPANDLKRYEGATEHVGLLSNKRSAYEGVFNDVGWPLQWQAQDYRHSGGPVMDHNLVPAYRMGHTGRGVVVAVVDGGMESWHDDLRPNVAEELSYDYVARKRGANHCSTLESYEALVHGTMVAGVIAMVANNSLCGTGVAFGAKIAGIRLLQGKTTELDEARSMIKNLDKIHIYSCSWGGFDNGRHMKRLSALTALSFATGADEGRSGRGAIYVFGGGAGKEEGDNCGADAYVNNQHTIAVASATQRGKVTRYGERCAAIMATAYGGGGIDGGDSDEFVYSTVTDKICAKKLEGNSPSTPIASGIIALTLQANPKLTYRDVMHLIAMTAEVAPLADNPDTWRRNAAGFWVSHDFGFGLLNAENMVVMARRWRPVTQLITCDLTFPIENPILTANKINTVTLDMENDDCYGKRYGIIYLESFQLNATISYPYRGALSISVTSPRGTTSTMLEPRKLDTSMRSLKKWTMKSNQAWGEFPFGRWTVTIRADAFQRGGFGRFFDHLSSGFSSVATRGVVRALDLRLHGTSVFSNDDFMLRTLAARRYSAFRLPDGRTSEDDFRGRDV